MKAHESRERPVRETLASPRTPRMVGVMAVIAVCLTLVLVGQYFVVPGLQVLPGVREAQVLEAVQRHPGYVHELVAGYGGARRDEVRQAVFAYARAGNFADTRALLRASLAQGVISDKEYFGELGHMLGVSEPEAPAIFREIIDSRNRYGAEVAFASIAANPFVTEKLSDADRAEMLSLLLNHAPAFSGAVSELGAGGVTTYSDWLASVENLLHDEARFIEFLHTHAMVGLKDPRAAFAFADRGYLSRLRAVGKDTAVQRLEKTQQDYLRDHPHSAVARSILSRPLDAS